MTRADLAEKVAKAIRVPKKNAKVIVDVLFERIIEALKKGEKVEFRGFGTFKVRVRNARTARNPKTGAPTQVPQKRVVAFKPHTDLKNKIH